MNLGIDLFPAGEQAVSLAPTVSWPICLSFGEIDNQARIFLTYEEAIALSRALREACGVDELQTVEPA